MSPSGARRRAPSKSPLEPPGAPLVRRVLSRGRLRAHGRAGQAAVVVVSSSTRIFPGAVAAARASSSVSRCARSQRIKARSSSSTLFSSAAGATSTFSSSTAAPPPAVAAPRRFFFFLDFFFARAAAAASSSRSSSAAARSAAACFFRQLRVCLFRHGKALEDVGRRVVNVVKVYGRQRVRHPTLPRLVEGPELPNAAPRQVEGEALKHGDEIRLHERLACAHKTFERLLRRKSPGDEIIEVDDVVEEARLGEPVREVLLPGRVQRREARDGRRGQREAVGHGSQRGCRAASSDAVAAYCWSSALMIKTSRSAAPRPRRR